MHDSLSVSDRHIFILNIILQQDHSESQSLHQLHSHSSQVRPESQNIHNEGLGVKCQARGTYLFQVVTALECDVWMARATEKGLKRRTRAE